LLCIAISLLRCTKAAAIRWGLSVQRRPSDVGGQPDEWSQRKRGSGVGRRVPLRKPKHRPI